MALATDTPALTLEAKIANQVLCTIAEKGLRQDTFTIGAPIQRDGSWVVELTAKDTEEFGRLSGTLSAYRLRLIRKGEESHDAELRFGVNFIKEIEAKTKLCDPVWRHAGTPFHAHQLHLKAEQTRYPTREQRESQPGCCAIL